MTKKKTVFTLRKHFSVYFKLYQQANIDLFESASYQDKIMTLELLTAFLENRNPDWNQAPYLDKAEAERRNKSYSK